MITMKSAMGEAAQPDAGKQIVTVLVIKTTAIKHGSYSYNTKASVEK